jgi:hypothetical protein
LIVLTDNRFDRHLLDFDPPGNDTKFASKMATFGKMAKNAKNGQKWQKWPFLPKWPKPQKWPLDRFITKALIAYDNIGTSQDLTSQNPKMTLLTFLRPLKGKMQKMAKMAIFAKMAKTSKMASGQIHYKGFDSI